MSEQKKLKCFVIGPIGDANSEARRQADWLYEGIVVPALSNLYDILRADKIAAPGLITIQVIEQVLESDLVVADLTDQNPNAFYELALRHMVGKPVIHMLKDGQRVPFDNADYRTIFYATDWHQRLVDAVDNLTKAADETRKPGYTTTTPVSAFHYIERLKNEARIDKNALPQLIDNLVALRSRVSSLEQELASSKQQDADRELIAKWAMRSSDENRSPFSQGIGALVRPGTITKSDLAKIMERYLEKGLMTPPANERADKSDDRDPEKGK